MLVFYFYMILGISLFMLSAVLLLAVVAQFRLREKYGVFSVKFGVDIVTALSVLVLAALSTDDTQHCTAVRTFSVTVPLIQSLLMLSECVDWALTSLATIFYRGLPVLLHFVPFVVGLLLSAIVVTSLVLVDVITKESPCELKPSHSAVLYVYDLTLIVAVVCIVLLLFVLWKQRNSDVALALAVHTCGVFFFLVVPLIIVLVLRYAGSSHAKHAIQATTMTTVVRAIAHSSVFLVNHKDFQRGVMATRNCHVLTSL